MTNEKRIIEKLIKIADNQQKIINKLAQIKDNISYLIRAGQTAAANTKGFTAKNISVKSNQNSSNPSNVIIENGYIIIISGASAENELRQKFINTLQRQIQTQRPELSGALSIVFDS